MFAKQKQLTLILTTFIIFFVIYPVHLVAAHDSKTVHPGLTNKAIDLKLKIHGSNSKFYSEIQTKKLRELIVKGTIEEDSFGFTRTMKDNPLYYSNPFYYYAPWAGHFYNPATGRGLGGVFTPATEFGQEYFDEAVSLNRICHVSCSCRGAKTKAQNHTMI